MADFSLVCWYCGKSKSVSGDLPHFGYELAKAAIDVGWRGCLDAYRGRVLVFCTSDCLDKSKTRSGRFRARPPKLEAASDQNP